MDGRMDYGCMNGGMGSERAVEEPGLAYRFIALHCHVCLAGYRHLAGIAPDADSAVVANTWLAVVCFLAWKQRGQVRV